jgi:hypothetical protein
MRFKAWKRLTAVGRVLASLLYAFINASSFILPASLIERAAP